MNIFLYYIIKLAASSYCDGLNTVFAFNNECVCIDGFPFGDPESKEGCYRCDQKCHRLAKCEYPGKCVCISPYHGDGINCVADIPQLTSVSPTNGSTLGGTDIEIYYNYSTFNDEKIPETAYCRFGPLVVRSESVSDSIITCKTPPHCAKPAFLSISFDTISWSKDDVFFNFVEIQENEKNYDNTQNVIVDEMGSNRNKNFGFLLVSIICFILLSSLFAILLKRFKAEKIPFAFRRKAIMD